MKATCKIGCGGCYQLRDIANRKGQEYPFTKEEQAFEDKFDNTK
jgi:hypothetical protein